MGKEKCNNVVEEEKEIRAAEREVVNAGNMVYKHSGCRWVIKSPEKKHTRAFMGGWGLKISEDICNLSQAAGTALRDWERNSHASPSLVMKNGRKEPKLQHLWGSKWECAGSLYSKERSVKHQMFDQDYSSLKQSSIPWHQVSSRDALWWTIDIPLSWFYCLLFCLALNKRNIQPMKLYGPSRESPRQNRIYCKPS